MTAGMRTLIADETHYALFTPERVHCFCMILEVRLGHLRVAILVCQEGPKSSVSEDIFLAIFAQVTVIAMFREADPGFTYGMDPSVSVEHPRQTYGSSVVGVGGEVASNHLYYFLVSVTSTVQIVPRV